MKEKARPGSGFRSYRHRTRRDAFLSKKFLSQFIREEQFSSVSHAGHFAPFDLRIFGACFCRNPTRSLANNLDAPDDRILTLSVFIKLVPILIKHVVDR